jgi:hypothetical protein
MSDHYGLFAEIRQRYQRSTRRFDVEFAQYSLQERTELLYGILQICETARTFDWTPEQQARDRDRNAISDAKSAEKYARGLASYCQSYPLQSMPALMSAMLKTGVHLRMKGDNEPIERGVALSPSHSIRLANLLRRVAEEIASGNLAAKRGPFTHRTRHGPLDYRKPIEDNADLPEPTTALAIYLAFVFRKHSLENQLFLQPGENTPKGGRPRWRLINEFVCEALEADGDFKDSASKVLRRNPDLGMVGYRWGRNDQ